VPPKRIRSTPIASCSISTGRGRALIEVVRSAHEVRDRLLRLGLESFCRTTGGKGLHIVVPLLPEADWEQVKLFCRAFAEAMADEFPDRYLAHLKIADRRGRILVDWLRNGMGATAISTFCPRARAGATVATPIAWTEVSPKLDPMALTIRTVPDRVAKMRKKPWQGFGDVRQKLPALGSTPSRALRTEKPVADTAPAKRSSIVHAAKPRPRR
jgi:bifunctional non-homologous end joining protein LigD